MSFLEDGTPITKETIDEAVEAIALACALGVRQYETIVQLIEDGKVESHVERIPGRAGSTMSVIGDNLSYKSWMGMVKRLKKAGFRVERKVNTNQTITYRLVWGSSSKEVAQ